MSTDPKSTYYDWGGIEALEVMQRKLNIIEYMGACKFMILKYIMRMEHKGDILRDAEKAVMYAKRLSEAQKAYSSYPFNGKGTTFIDISAREVIRYDPTNCT